MILFLFFISHRVNVFGYFGLEKTWKKRNSCFIVYRIIKKNTDRSVAFADIPRRHVRWSQAIINRDVTSWFVTLFWFGMRLLRIKNSFPFVKSQSATGRYIHIYLCICETHGNCFRMQAHKKLVSVVSRKDRPAGPIL